MNSTICQKDCTEYMRVRHKRQKYLYSKSDDAYGTAATDDENSDHEESTF